MNKNKLNLHIAVIPADSEFKPKTVVNFQGVEMNVSSYDIHGTPEEIVVKVARNAAMCLSKSEFPDDLVKQLERFNYLADKCIKPVALSVI